MERLIVQVLNIPSKHREGFLRFECPHCREWNSAINPRTNLARCFTCRINFNTIDLVMRTRHIQFKQAVAVLKALLPQP